MDSRFKELRVPIKVNDIADGHCIQEYMDKFGVDSVFLPIMPYLDGDRIDDNEYTQLRIELCNKYGIGYTILPIDNIVNLIVSSLVHKDEAEICDVDVVKLDDECIVKTVLHKLADRDIWVSSDTVNRINTIKDKIRDVIFSYYVNEYHDLTKHHVK